MTEEALLLGLSGLIGVSLARSLTFPPPKPIEGMYFFHVKHDPNIGLRTIGKIANIRNSILRYRSGYIGIMPQCKADWATELSYYSECRDIPTMATVLSSDSPVVGEAYMLDLAKIAQVVAVADVRYLRMHEVVSYYRDILQAPLPTDYIRSVLEYAKNAGISVFWNEWDNRAYPVIAETIAGYEDVVAVSFGTNANYIEPAEGYQLLESFARKGASVQSWYWYERQGRIAGTEMQMPPDLMVQHTHEAFAAGCEVVQYEPFWYFFFNEYPKPPLQAVLTGL